MFKHEMKHQQAQIVNLGGVVPDEMPPLIVYGIHGGSDFVTGICVGDTVMDLMPYDPITATPAESIDGLIVRAARTLVPSLPATAPRGVLGQALGYLIYRELHADHCRPVEWPLMATQADHE